MNSKKFSFVMTGGLALLGLLLVASIYLGDAFLHKQSNKLAGLKLDTRVIEEQQTSLVTANKDIQKYAELKTIADQIVPHDKDQARATREILNLAEQSGIKISSITFPASTLGQAAPKAPPTTDKSATDAPAKPAQPSVTQVKTVEGIKGLYQLDITIASDTRQAVSYDKLVNFLGQLEQNRRTAQVSQIAIQPDPLNRAGLNFTLTVTVYIKP